MVTQHKQTEFGCIPENWEFKAIDSLIDLLTGFPFKSENYSNEGIKLLRGSNVKRGTIDWNPEITAYWQEITSSLKQYLLKEGDIVIAMDGSLVGKSFARLTKKDLPALLLQRVARIRSNKIDMGYLKEFICSDYFSKHCETVKTVSAIPHISPHDIKTFQIPVPPTKTEQTAIATALNHAGTIITSLQRLIAKKKAIKQGVMQEILRPSEGWKSKKLEDIIQHTQLGGNYLTTKEINGLPLIKMGNIQRGKISLSKIEYILKNKASDADRLKEGDFLFNTRNTLDLVGKVTIWRNELPIAYFNSNIMRITFKEELVASTGFMNALFNTQYIISLLKEIAIGTTSVAAIYSRHLFNLEIKIPDFKEQKGIAQILSDMDAEIALLEKKLEKQKLLKQGMMQVLLTGKIRLV